MYSIFIVPAYITHVGGDIMATKTHESYTRRTSYDISPRIIGFIGLGEMGGPMACNLMSAGYAVVGFDLDAERLTAATGIESARSTADVVRHCDVIVTSLPSSSSFVAAAKNEIPAHRPIRPDHDSLRHGFPARDAAAGYLLRRKGRRFGSMCR